MLTSFRAYIEHNIERPRATGRVLQAELARRCSEAELERVRGLDSLARVLQGLGYPMERARVEGERLVGLWRRWERGLALQAGRRKVPARFV